MSTDPETPATQPAGASGPGPRGSVDAAAPDGQLWASEQALRNFIALAPYARRRDPAAGRSAAAPARVAAADRAADAALVRAVQLGAISAHQAQRELVARWTARPDPASTPMTTADTAPRVPERLPIDRDLAARIAEEAIELFLENRDQHGLDETQARSAAILDIAEGAPTPDDPPAQPPAATAPADTGREASEDDTGSGHPTDAARGDATTAPATRDPEPDPERDRVQHGEPAVGRNGGVPTCGLDEDTDTGGDTAAARAGGGHAAGVEGRADPLAQAREAVARAGAAADGVDTDSCGIGEAGSFDVTRSVQEVEMSGLDADGSSFDATRGAGLGDDAEAWDVA